MFPLGYSILSKSCDRKLVWFNYAKLMVHSLLHLDLAQLCYGIEKKSIPFIMECNAYLIKDKLVSQNPMEIILLPQKSWIRPKQILTLKEIRTELQINRNKQWRRPFSDPYQLPRFCIQAVSSVCLNSSGQQNHITALSYT